MSFSRKKLFPVLIIIFALCASLFSGCGAKIEPQQGDGAGTDNSAAVTPEHNADAESMTDKSSADALRKIDFVIAFFSPFSVK